MNCLTLALLALSLPAQNQTANKPQEAQQNVKQEAKQEAKQCPKQPPPAVSGAMLLKCVDSKTTDGMEGICCYSITEHTKELGFGCVFAQCSRIDTPLSDSSCQPYDMWQLLEVRCGVYKDDSSQDPQL